MIKKKCLLFTGVVTLLFLLVSVTGVYAAVDITPDTSWYTGNDTTYTLNTPEELTGLAAIVNGTANGIKADSFEGVTILLGSDIVFNNTDKVIQDTISLRAWDGIGSLSGNAFKGIFDGQNHIISGLYGKTTGLFGQTCNATIKNLTIDKSTVSTSDSITGMLVGYGKGTLTVENVHIKDCYVKDYSNSTGDVGGIVGGVIQGTFTNCTVSNSKVICYNCDYTGGIAGYIDCPTSFTNCSVSDTVIVCAKSGAGGIGGCAFTDVNFTDCSVDSCYVQSVYDNYVGGILGFCGGEANFDGCHVTDSLLKAYKHSVGGLAGYTYHANLENNPSTVRDTIVLSESGEYVGGLIGSANKPVSISATGCSVTSSSIVGGPVYISEAIGAVIGRGTIDTSASPIDVAQVILSNCKNDEQNKNTDFNSTGTTYDESKWIVSKKISETVDGTLFGTSEKTYDVPIIRSDLTTKEPSETTTTVTKSPFPVLGILAGLGAAAVFIKRRR